MLQVVGGEAIMTKKMILKIDHGDGEGVMMTTLIIPE